MLIRRATPADANELAHVHVRAWQMAYQGLLPADYLASLDPRAWAGRYSFAATDPASPATYLCSTDGQIAGFITVTLTWPDRQDRMPELSALYVAPELWGHGVGSALHARGLEELRQAGTPTAAVWILEGNLHARRFYEHKGWVATDMRRSATVRDLEVPVLCMTLATEIDVRTLNTSSGFSRK